MCKTVIIGFGNLLMGDDGVGIHAIHKLSTFSLPEDVVIIDGGVNTFAAFSYLQDATRVFFIDAVAGGGRPGDIYRLTAEDLQAGGVKALSVHDFSLESAIIAAKCMNTLPPIIIWGIEPGKLDLDTELTPEVASALNVVIARILAELSCNSIKGGSENVESEVFTQVIP